MSKTADDDHPLTHLVHAGSDPAAQNGLVNTPVHRGSTILKPDLASWEEAHRPGYQGYSYGRCGNPNSNAFETALAGLYRADDAITVSSGLGAISTALLAVVRSGDHILITDSTYGPCRRFCDGVLRRFGVEIGYYDPLIGRGIAELLRPNTRLVYLESPGSLTFEVQDVPAIAAAARAQGVLTMIDNTWATGLYFNPFDHGVDIVVESITKYVGGHSDLMMGAILGRGKIAETLRLTATQSGQCVSPDDLFLATRGLRSLGVRLPRHQENGLALARWLQARPEIEAVLHPALPQDPGHALWTRDFTGASGLFGFRFRPAPEQAIAALVDGLRFFGIGASWGGYESLIQPAHLTRNHAGPATEATGPLFRIHAGLEAAEDLIADLDAGFARMHAFV